MKHTIIRALITLVWFIAAIVGFVQGNYQMSLLYSVVGIAFIWSALSNYRKGIERSDRKGR